MPTGFKRIGTVSAKVTRRGLLRPVDQDDERTPTMAEVKRYTRDGESDSLGPRIDFADYARLERERDESRRAFERAETDVQALVRERDEYKSVADSMGRDAVEFSAKLAEAQAELTRLRAVEAAAKHLIYAEEKGRITDFMPALRALAEVCGRNG